MIASTRPCPSAPELAELDALLEGALRSVTRRNAYRDGLMTPNNRTFVLAFTALASFAPACGNSDSNSGTGGPSGGGSGGGGSGASGGTSGGGAAGETGTCNADLTSDPEHCGECFHSCAGGACVEGACQQVDVLTFDNAPTRMAIGGDYVVWVDGFNSRVGYGTKDGSISESFFNSGFPSNVAATATHMYWTVAEDVPGSANLRRRPFAGSSSETLFGGGSAYELALDEARVYWFDHDATDTGSALHDGSDRIIWSDTANGISLQVDAERLFWIYLQDVYSCPKTDCSAPIAMGLSLGTDAFFRTLLAVDDTHLYMADQFGMYRVDKNGGVKETILDEAATGLALDDGFIYFSVPSKGAVARMPKAGGAVEVIASDQGEPTDVRVDDTAVFWLDKGDAAIRKIAKPLP